MGMVRGWVVPDEKYTEGAVFWYGKLDVTGKIVGEIIDLFKKELW